MKSKVLVVSLLGALADGFVSPSSALMTKKFRTQSSATMGFGLDPTVVQGLTDNLAGALGSISLSDAVDAVADAAPAAADAANGNGWFGFLVGPTEGLLQGIHSVLETVGVEGNAWGVSIIMLTLLIKALTFPLTKTQLESTNKMQAMQPEIKAIQAKYQSNPEVMNQKIAEFYQTNQINPLAGCIPSLVQIPIFIGLYRAVLNLAKENKLDEPFLWLPNLEGPTYGADPAHGSDWILSGWTDGVPTLGWSDTIAFLVLPLFLVVSQFASMQMMQPKSDDPAQQQSNAILKFLPLMIGWFSLNVPAALCLYWVVNNIVTTATSIIIRNNMTTAPVKASGTGTAATAASVFAPSREKPSGFGDATARRTTSMMDDVKPITPIDSVVGTGAVDAEMVDKSTTGDDAEDEDETVDKSEPSKKRGGKKKRKKTN